VIDLIKELQQWGVKVVVTDTWADPAEVKHEYGIDLELIDSNKPVDALVVAVGHEEFRLKTLQELRQLCKGDQPVLGDIKSLYDRHEAKKNGFTVFRF
jgi:UDP-N-acetyl-D-galactosamine dehydrogenase